MLDDTKILRIASILNLSTTKNRENTISSLITNILFQYNEELTATEIYDLIKETFNIQPFKNEIEESLRKQVAQGNMEEVAGLKYKLSEKSIIPLRKDELHYKLETEERFKRFEVFVRNMTKDIDEIDLKELWSAFNNYIYECFYQYGENAIKHFQAAKPEEEREKLIDESPYKNSITKIKPTLKDLFKKVIIQFAYKLDLGDIIFLESLAKKTLSFYSLGLPKELHEEIEDINLVDWIIFVDTNFLYSILNLHKHPENEASIEFLNLVQRNNLKIKFKFIPVTLKELQHKKEVFEELIPKTNFKESHIKSLLQSEKLDAFSQAYYEKYLKDPSSTLHPSEVINTAERTLTYVKHIEKYNAKYEMFEESYLNARVTEYERYLNVINETRGEKGLPPKFKHETQLYHDIFLREIIDYLRFQVNKERPKTFSEIKFLGVTLDKTLINYDKAILSKTAFGDFIIPNFFLPSFLLGKIYQLLPLQTENYKQAFITAIATFSFFENIQTSKDIQKFVNYYKNMGLDDDKLLLSFITDEFFIKRFFENETEEKRKDFIESEINKKFKELNIKAVEAEKENTELKEKLSGRTEESQSTSELLKKNESIIRDLKLKEELLETELKKVKLRKEALTPAIAQRSLTDEIEIRNLQDENKNIKETLASIEYKQLLEEYYKKKKLFKESKWIEFSKKKKYIFLWYLLFWILPGIILFIIYENTEIDNPLVKYLIPIVIYIANSILSFINKNSIAFSFNYLFNKGNLKRRCFLEFDEQFTEEPPLKPVI